MNIQEVIKIISGFDDVSEAKQWYMNHRNEIVTLLADDAESDLSAATVSIENIASAFNGRVKTAIKQELKILVKMERERRMYEQVRDDIPEGLKFVRDDKGNRVPTQENIVTILLNNRNLHIYFDEYSNKIYYEGKIPWNSELPREQIKVNDKTYISATAKYQKSALKQYLLKFFNRECSWRALDDALLYAARQNHINIYKDYFDSLPEWDFIDRMDFLHRYAGVENKDWASVAGHSIFLGMMARCYDPGYDYRGVVVLEGPQNSGKSRLCGLLAFHKSFFHQFFFTKYMEGYEVTRQIAGKAVVEFPEMGGTRGKDQNYIKAFLSSLNDTNRPMHSDDVEYLPRSGIFIITTNEGGRYFMDLTGNTRYIPVYCHAINIDIDAIQTELLMLLAQAKYLWEIGVKPHLTDAELELQKTMVASREMRPDYYDRVLEQLKLHRNQMVYHDNENWDDGFTMDEMLQWMETETWFPNSSKTKHRDEIRKVLPKYFQVESVVKRIPIVRRNSADPELTRKWRYVGKQDFSVFIDSLEED